MSNKNKIIDAVVKKAQFTAIDNRFTIKDIKNYNSLPKEVKEIVKATETIRSHGFQEILGYKGRQIIWSMGGYWDNDNEKDSKFDADSFGGSGIQWDGSKVTKKG